MNRSYDTAAGIVAAFATYAEFHALIQRREEALDRDETLDAFVIFGGRILLSATNEVLFAQEFKGGESSLRQVMTLQEYDAEASREGTHLRRDRVWQSAGSELPAPRVPCIVCGKDWSANDIRFGFKSELVANDAPYDTNDVTGMRPDMLTIYWHVGACDEKRERMLKSAAETEFVAMLTQLLTHRGFDDVRLTKADVPARLAAMLPDGIATPSEHYYVANTEQGSFALFVHEGMTLDLHGTSITASELCATSPQTDDPPPDPDEFYHVDGNGSAITRLCLRMLKRKLAALTGTPPRSRTGMMRSISRQER